jgi:hypothetical protein
LVVSSVAGENQRGKRLGLTLFVAGKDSNASRKGIHPKFHVFIIRVFEITIEIGSNNCDFCTIPRASRSTSQYFRAVIPNHQSAASSKTSKLLIATTGTIVINEESISAPNLSRCFDDDDV